MERFIVGIVLVCMARSVVSQTTTFAPIVYQHFNYPASCAAPNQTISDPNVHTPMPPLPYLPDSFQTRVEANIIDKGKTVVAEEYFDSFNNLASVRTIMNNVMDYMVFDYANSQLLYVINNTCHAADLVTDDNNELFGLMKVNGLPHVYSTNGALHFAKANGLTYKGITTVRGIPVDHWQSCLYWQQLFSNFTLDYYFARPNWTDSVGFPSIPVRAEIMGLQTFLSNYTFHHIYEYFDFRSRLWADHTVFETPKGMTCLNRKQTRKVPQLGPQYSYREEIIDSNSKQVSEADIWFDFTYKLVRFDYRPPYIVAPFNAKNPVTEVHDYNTGIRYAMDRSLGNCSILPIANFTFDSNVNVSTNSNSRQQFTVRMKSPSQLFYLDNSYTYEGQRTCREMLCDVFIANRTDFSLSGYAPFVSTFEFYFLATTWLSVNNVGKTSAQNLDIPIQLDISTPSNVGYSASYNIYNFDMEQPDFSRFDITSCYDDFSKLPIRINFQNTYDSSVFAYKSTFLKQAIAKLIQVTHLTPIRVQKTEFHMEPDNAYLLATLTASPPSIAFYRQLPGQFLQYSNDKSVTVSSASDCADQCNSITDFTCNSFDYCAGQNLCSLSKTHTEDGQLAPSHGLCDHYSRTVDKSAFEMTLGKAWQLLRDVVIQADFVLKVPLNGVTKSYAATSVTDNVIQNGQRQITTQTLLQQFNGQVNKAIPGYDDLILSGEAIDDCAASCINQEGWICNSFEFCFDSGYCTLSKLHPDTRPGIVVNKQFCDLYSRKYTSAYQKSDGMTVLSSSDTIYENIYSADQCAELCSNYNGFNCKSFDYCDGITTCFLGRTHLFDVPAADRQSSNVCSHYSRNYISDFKQNTRRQISNRDDRIVSGISAQECAKLCVEEESFSCASFDYCSNATECRLSTASMKNIGQVSIETTQWCDVYNRESFPDGTAYINNPQKYYSIPAAKTGYTSGAMAGLGFGMLVLGLLIAFGALFAYSKFKGVPMDNMKVAFVKDESES